MSAARYAQRVLPAGLIIIDPADFTETKLIKRKPYLDIGLTNEQVDTLFKKFKKSEPANIRSLKQILQDDKIKKDKKKEKKKERRELHKQNQINTLTGDKPAFQS